MDPTEPVDPLIPSLDGVHVLVLDDDYDAREIVRSTLRYFGALVVSVASAKKALEAMARVRPQVIVCDLAMPEEDGLSFIRTVRLLADWRSVRIVAVTAYGHWYRTETILAAGFDAVLRKPISPPELVRLVARLAGRTV